MQCLPGFELVKWEVKKCLKIFYKRFKVCFFFCSFKGGRLFYRSLESSKYDLDLKNISNMLWNKRPWNTYSIIIAKRRLAVSHLTDAHPPPLWINRPKFFNFIYLFIYLFFIFFFCLTLSNANKTCGLRFMIFPSCFPLAHKSFLSNRCF